MSDAEQFKSLRTGPITEGELEPDWIHDLPADNVVATMTALAAEIHILKDRLRAMERELERHKVLPEGVVEKHSPTVEEQEADQAELERFSHRFWSELTRPRTQWAKVGKDAPDYFPQPEDS